MRALENERGFALVESIGTLVFASLALGGGLIVVYVSFAHQWLKHAAYETSICLSTPAIVSTCERGLRDSTSRALPVGSIEKVYLSRSRTNVKTRFHWRLNNEIVLAVEDVRSVPLLGKL